MISLQRQAIIVADDHSIVFSGIQLLLSFELPTAELEEATDGEKLLIKLKERSFDLLILDINMPGTDTHSLIHTIQQLYPEMKILIYSMSPEEIYALRFMKLGVHGFLTKEAPRAELTTAVKTVLAGKYYFSSKTLQQLSEKLVGGKIDQNEFHLLSVREFEIMSQLIKGMSVKQICSITNLHPSTIGTHKTRIFSKLQVKNVIELKNLARLHGIISD